MSDCDPRAGLHSADQKFGKDTIRSSLITLCGKRQPVLTGQLLRNDCLHFNNLIICSLGISVGIDSEFQEQSRKNEENTMKIQYTCDMRMEFHDIRREPLKTVQIIYCEQFLTIKTNLN